MSATVIRARGLGKSFRIAGKQDHLRTFREMLQEAAAAPFRRASQMLRGSAHAASDLTETFWALRHVDFEIRQGEVIGVIGRNGAGKSTLLKILSRIIEPGEGYVDIVGRVGSLLEVGTGFHSELTGRENIFLNAAILGMSRSEIDEKIDPIIDFAEIDQFVDTPVKYYSSGMYLRLAFAVAAHLDPEILLVDEVLAVGDAEFQKKCLGRMSHVAEAGRTVLFVSHNMGAIAQLCEKCIWLRRGGVAMIGATDAVIAAYLQGGEHIAPSVSLTDYPQRIGTGDIRFVSAQLGNSAGLADTFQMGEDLAVEFTVRAYQPKKQTHLSVNIKTSSGIPVLHMTDFDGGFQLRNVGPEDRRIRVRVPQLRLYPGQYLVSLWISDPFGQVYDYVQDCLSFTVIQSDFTRSPYSLTSRHGLFLHPTEWCEIAGMELVPRGE